MTNGSRFTRHCWWILSRASKHCNILVKIVYWFISTPRLGSFNSDLAQIRTIYPFVNDRSLLRNIFKLNNSFYLIFTDFIGLCSNLIFINYQILSHLSQKCGQMFNSVIQIINQKVSMFKFLIIYFCFVQLINHFDICFFRKLAYHFIHVEEVLEVFFNFVIIFEFNF